MNQVTGRQTGLGFGRIFGPLLLLLPGPYPGVGRDGMKETDAQRRGIVGEPQKEYFS